MEELFRDEELSAESPLAARLGGCDRLISAFGAGDARAEMRLAALSGAGSAAFVPIRPPAEHGAHLVDLWSDLLGLDAPDRWSGTWAVPDAWLAEVADNVGPGRVILHPGAGAREKCWPLERFEALADGLDRKGREPLFVLGPVELDRWGPSAVDRLRARWNVAADWPLQRLAAALASCGAYCGNDSGASHLAAAVGAPTVALFGPTRPEHFRPLGPRVRVVAAETMSEIQVGEVLDAVDAFGPAGR
jgi:ADP-heptose:LPS heptosyltransferase